MGVNVKKAADILVTNMLSRPWFISLWSQYVHHSSRYRDNIVYHEYYLSKNKSGGGKILHTKISDHRSGNSGSVQKCVGAM